MYSSTMQASCQNDYHDLILLVGLIVTTCGFASAYARFVFDTALVCFERYCLICVLLLHAVSGKLHDI